MRHRTLWLAFQFVALSCLSAIQSNAQYVPGCNGKFDEIVLTKLAAPTYPQLAQQARISGDVTIQINVRRDGGVASAEAITGHPMLKTAALASAQNSSFECRGCTEELTACSLTYTFGWNNDSDCSFERPRSAQCLYLWHCGGPRAVYHNIPSPSVTQSDSHITILAGSRCVQTQSSRPTL